MVAKTLKIAFCMIVFLFCGMQNLDARKDFAVGTQVYDAQIDSELKVLLAPLAEKAGIDIKQSRLYLIIDPSFGAWATVDNTFGLHTGFLKKCETVEQFLAVMAHEFGHVNARHLVRSQETFGRIAQQGLMMTTFAALAGLAVGAPGASMAALLGGMSVVERGLLGYSRAQEHTADQAAVAFFKSLNWPVSAVRDMMVVLKKEEAFYPAQNSYASTHPPTSERIEYLGSSLESAPGASVPSHYKEIWDRVQWKIKAIVDEPEDIIKGLASQESDNILFARSIAYYRLEQTDSALQDIRKLIEKNPNNPYYHALKAQILWGNADIRSASNEYLIAQKLMPDELEFKIEYARSLIELKEKLDTAILLLEDVVVNNKRILDSWPLLTEAYGAKNRQGELAWAQAEYSAQLGEKDKAKGYAKKAETLLDKGSKHYLFLKVLLEKLNG